MADPSIDMRCIAEAIHALRDAHDRFETGVQVRLDHRPGENDDGCTFCHAIAALEGRTEPLTEDDY